VADCEPCPDDGGEAPPKSEEDMSYTDVKRHALIQAYAYGVGELFDIFTSTPPSKIDAASQHFARGFDMLERCTRLAAQVMGLKLKS